ncbi:MAG: hypothetical protein FJX62_05485 [Alphaproteobacteria bacterium]|nr:hypothetical protein [Alphaproteobacteria bacterium]
MRQPIVAAAVLAVSTLVAQTAWAKTFPIRFVDRDTLAAACKKHAGATSYSQSGGIYGCVGAGVVECNDNTKTCTGTTNRGGPSQDFRVVLGIFAPAKPSKPQGVFGAGILESGPALGSQGPSATGAPASSGAPSAPPVIIR